MSRIKRTENSFKKLAGVVMIAVIVVSILAFFISVATASTWWNTSWQSRIDNALSNGTRPFQISLNISNSTGTNNDTHVFLSCQAINCSDIRFTLDNTTELPHWFETNTTSGGAWGKVWVNVTENGTVNLYYGNPSATYDNSLGGKNTFPFFWQNNSTILTDAFTVTGSVTIDNGRIKIEGGNGWSTGGIIGKTPLKKPFVLEWQSNYSNEDATNSVDGIAPLSGLNINTMLGFIRDETGAGEVFRRLNTSNSATLGNWHANTNYNNKLIVDASGDYTLFIDGVSLNTGTFSADGWGFMAQIYHANQFGFYNNIIARKHAFPEPAWATWGSQQSQPVGAVNLTNISALSSTTLAGINATYFLNLTNNGTATDTYTITFSNIDGATTVGTNITQVTLDAGQSRIFSLNVTNATLASSFGLFLVNVTATSNNDSSKFGYINTTTNVTATYATSLLNISAITQSTNAGVNLTYVINLTNNGTGTDTYTLTIDNANSATTASLNISSPVTLHPGESRIFALNVTNATLTHTKFQLFLVNVTATSNNDSSKFGYINTTTNVTATYATSLLNISAITQSTNAGVNLTYVINLTNNGTGTDTYTLTIDNANSAATASLNISSSVTLHSGQSMIFALNVTNVTAGTFHVNVTARSNNDSTRFGYINTTTTVTGVVVYGANLANISVLARTTPAGTNATYTLNLTNNGTAADSYTLTIDNPNSASTAALNISSPVFLNAGESRIFNLNVTNVTAGTFHVNVTARSNNDSTRFGYINTTTTVAGVVVYGANLANISVLARTAPAGTNATYTLSLNNNGTATDSYTLAIDNPDSASTAALNISSPVFLNAGESRIFNLNVTNVTAGIFRVNVTARSNNDSTRFGYINTTTTVTGVVPPPPPSGGEGKVKGNGWIVSPIPPVKKNNKATFDFDAKNMSIVSGKLEYNDHAAGLKVKGDVTSFSINKAEKTATFSGTATIKIGKTTTLGTYTAIVWDNSKKGKNNDRINITLSTGYTANATLGGGSIKIDP